MSSYVTVLVTTIVLIGGCGSPGGLSEFRFENETDTTIWVNTVSGFRNDPSCGPLTKKQKAELSFFPAQQVPSEVKITWWKGKGTAPESDSVTTTIDFSKVPASQRVGTLVFRYTKGDKWVGEFAPVVND